MTSNVEVIRECGKGMAVGGLIGGSLSVATGAAVICTAPGWLPFVGGATVVSTGTVFAWSAVGSAVGGATGAGRCLFRHRKYNCILRKMANQS